MNKNKAFTLIEVIVSLALFALITIMIVSLLDFTTSSTTKTERAAEATSNSSVTKELLVKTISPSTSIEILDPISTNDLTEYVDDLENDSEYIYLYTIDGVVYYRNPGTDTTGSEIKVTATTDVDFGFLKSSLNDKTLDINMTFSTKEVEPYVLNEELNITPLNFGTDEVIKDNRTDTSVPSNIIRYISEEIIVEDVAVSDDLIILSATAYDIPIYNTPSRLTLKGEYDIPFYVSQQPKVVQLYNYAHLADNGEKIIKQETIDMLWNYERTDAYFNNTVIGQSTFVTNNNPTTHEISFVYKGYKFIDIYGNEYIGEPNGDGTRTVKIKIPTYSTTENMKFAVTSEKGAYLSYEFKVVTEVPTPEIVSFEFLPEDNNIPYKLKTYINQNDVYYTSKSTSKQVIDGTEGAARPAMFPDLYTGTQTLKSDEAFYSTIVMPTNPVRRDGDFYPNLKDQANSWSDDTELSSKVATITFRGTSLHHPDGDRISVPETEWGKLNGVEEVTTKVSIDKDFTGAVDMLNGEKYADIYKDSGLTTQKGVKFEDYTFKAYKSANTTDEWFDPKNDINESWNVGKGYTFSVANGPIIKRYTYQHEASTTKPDYHKGVTSDSGLNRVWVDGFMEGAWVGGSMRGDVSGEIVVKVPYDKYDSIKNNVTLKASVYGDELVQLPSYPYGTYSRAGATKTTDNYSYYGLTDKTYSGSNTTKTEVTLKSDTTSPYSSIRYNADYLKHFVLIQNGREYGPMVRYQVKIEKSYPRNVIEPEIESIRIYESTNNNVDKTYIKNSGSFTPNSNMATKYTKGAKINMNIAFAGSKIKIGTSIDPRLCDEFTNKITNKNTYYEVPLQGLEYDKDYFIHLYDYQGDWKEAYMITKGKMYYTDRRNAIYSLSSEMARSLSVTNFVGYNGLPYLPVKTEVPGSSYGYHTNNSTENLLETPIKFISNGYDSNALLPYFGGTYYKPGENNQSYAPENLAKYSLTGQGKTTTPYWRMYIRSTRTDYSNGGNNLNTASQYNLTNFMTPVILNKKHMLYKDDKGVAKYSNPYDTDYWGGIKSYLYISPSRRTFETSNVKLNTTGFNAKIFSDRVYSQKDASGNITERSVGRPGTVAETNFDIALVDTTTGTFNESSYAPDDGNNTDADFKYDLPHDNSPIPSEIKDNDVLGYGFSLIEQNVDRDPTQDYLGKGTERSERKNREVALMFYVRHFVAGEGADSNLGIDIGKVPGTYVKLADLTGFDMEATNSDGVTLYSQGVNFDVDIRTTFDGNTIITEDNYESIMKNNYIGFKITEYDIEDKVTGVVHTKVFPFADVFGGIRVDDHVNDELGYNELNLILNHIPRQTKTNTGRLDRPRLSVGYGTNWGLVGVDDFIIRN